MKARNEQHDQRMKVEGALAVLGSLRNELRFKGLEEAAKIVDERYKINLLLKDQLKRNEL